MSLLIEILGSIALLLWGLRMVRTGVIRSYGNNLKRLYLLQLQIYRKLYSLAMN
jgi:Na+/phosphate symporter